MISTSADRVRRSTRRRKIVLKIVRTHTRAAAGSAAGPSARMPAGKCPESEIARCGPGRPDLFPLPFCPDRRVDRGDPWGIVRAMAKSPFSLEGKTAIVTGGGTGIGKSIAIEFARAGADVALCSRKLEHLEPVVKAVRDVGKQSFAVAMDVRQEDQVKAMVDRAVQEWGRLDIMVNNAGAPFRPKPEDISVNGWNTVGGLNRTGAFLGCQG